MYNGLTFWSMMGRFGGGARGKHRGNRASDRQIQLEHMYIRVLSEMCVSRYKWYGLDDPRITSDELFLEKELLHGGLVVAYYDKRYDTILTPRANVAGQRNLYDNPTGFRVLGQGFIGGRISSKNCVPIWGSISRIPDFDIITLYAHRLATIDRTIEINSRNARKMRVVEASHDQRLTMANIDKAMDRGDPAIFVDLQTTGSQLVEQINAVDLGIDTKDIEELHILKVRQWNECMGLLGIDGANQDKKERLVSNEVEANAEQINLSKTRALYTRRKAAEEINAKFGTKIWVDYNVQDSGDSGFTTMKEAE